MPEPGTLAGLQSAGVLGGTLADIAAARETARRRRLRRMALVLLVPAAWLWIRLLSGDPVGWGMPDLRDAVMEVIDPYHFRRAG